MSIEMAKTSAPLVIACDTRQKRKHHTVKEQWWAEHGIRLVHTKLMAGDYTRPADGSVAVDTKADIRELYSNVISDHARFRAECQLAQECGIQLVILVDSVEGVTCIDDIPTLWKNPQAARYRIACINARRAGKRLPKPPASNAAFCKALHTMEEKYGVKFKFCRPVQAARTVCELLGLAVPDEHAESC